MRIRDVICHCAMSSETLSKLQPTSLARLRHWIVTLAIYVRWGVQLVALACVCVLMRTLWWICPGYKRKWVEVMDELTHMNTSKLQPADWGDTFFKFGFFKQEAKIMLLNLYKSVHLNGPAVNVDVITLDGKAAKLLDYSSDPERPLVVNFGSCT